MGRTIKRPAKRVTKKIVLPEVAKTSWTFFTNHAHVLILLAQNPTSLLREVALNVGITERAVQKIVAELARDGFLRRSKVGRHNEYALNLSQPLRHAIEQHKTIGDIVDVLAHKRAQ